MRNVCCVKYIHRWSRNVSSTYCVYKISHYLVSLGFHIKPVREKKKKLNARNLSQRSGASAQRILCAAATLVLSSDSSLSSRGFGQDCSWLDKSFLANLQLHIILEFLLLGSSLCLVQASVLSDRGRRPRAARGAGD